MNKRWRSDLLMREMTRVKSSEYSPDAMASKHSRAEILQPWTEEKFRGFILTFSWINYFLNSFSDEEMVLEQTTAVKLTTFWFIFSVKNTFVPAFMSSILETQSCVTCLWQH